MKKMLVFGSFVALVLATNGCSSGGGDSNPPSPPPATVGQQQTVTAQTSPNPAVQPAINPPPAPAPVFAPASGSGGITSVPQKPASVRAIGLAGWWYEQYSENHAAEGCKEFWLINEAQMLLVNGWECWAGAAPNYIVVNKYGPITAESGSVSAQNASITFSVTGGCYATTVGSTPQTLTITNWANGNLSANDGNSNPVLAKIPASTSFLQLNQGGSNPAMGCFNSSWTAISPLNSALQGVYQGYITSLSN